MLVRLPEFAARQDQVATRSDFELIALASRRQLELWCAWPTKMELIGREIQYAPCLGQGLKSEQCWQL